MWQAAELLGLDFKLFFSVDLTGSLGNLAGDIVSMVARYSGRPNTMKINGKVFLSTFVGQDKTFGFPTPQQGWQQGVIEPLRNQGIQVYLVPDFVPNVNPPGPGASSCLLFGFSQPTLFSFRPSGLPYTSTGLRDLCTIPFPRWYFSVVCMAIFLRQPSRRKQPG